MPYISKSSIFFFFVVDVFQDGVCVFFFFNVQRVVFPLIYLFWDLSALVAPSYIRLVN